MNISKRILRLSLCLIIAFSFSISVKAQQFSIKDRWNVKLAYSSYPNLGKDFGDKDDISPVFFIEGNYGVLNFLEIGGYTGYCSIKTVSNSISENFTSIENANTLFYGLNANVHLLPFLIKREKFRLDVYASIKCGGFYRSSSENMYPERGHTLDLGAYAGGAFYLGEHWGIFGEYGFGNKTNLRYGLSFKF